MYGGLITHLEQDEDDRRIYDEAEHRLADDEA